ncbi:MAG: hypothetical protein ACI83W_001965 [Marinoscillum sp.]
MTWIHRKSIVLHPPLRSHFQNELAKRALK